MGKQLMTLTIANGASNSNRIPQHSLNKCKSLSIHAPAALTGTITVASGDSDDDGATFNVVQSPPGTDVTVAAAKTTVLTEVPFPTMRLQSGGVEAGTRTFVVCLDIGE